MHWLFLSLHILHLVHRGHSIKIISVENIMLNERSQTRKATQRSMIPFMPKMSRIGKLREKEHRLVVAMGGGGESKEQLLNGYGVFFRVMKVFWN